jgi:hypothetical protein
LSTIAERVARGAALLDARRPGWWRDIDPGRLDIGSERCCVAGQLGGYLSVTRSLGLHGSLDDYVHGFDGGSDPEHAALTGAWRDLIGQRLAQAAVPA